MTSTWVRWVSYTNPVPSLGGSQTEEPAMTDPLVEEALLAAKSINDVFVSGGSEGSLVGLDDLLTRLADRVEELEAAIADGERYATEYGFDTSHRIRARLRQALSTHPTESETP